MDAPVTRQEVSPFADSGSGVPASPPSLVKPGDHVGRYRVVAPLGQGGMATVFSAVDPDLGRSVALKLLHAGAEDHRLEREARALASVSHPNVIAVYDVGRFMGRVFVAMELVEGVTLRHWLDQAEGAGSKLTLPAIMDIFLQAGRGLAAAHERGLVHRDFKPENVMIGNDGRVRVLDFGLVGAQSRPADGAPGVESELAASTALGGLTETGKVLGTPAYMALEQYSSAPPDARTDQYSFCVALWEALYGQRPFEADSILELLGRLKSGAPPQAGGAEHRVPMWLEALLRRGLSHQPESRFASIAELLGHFESGLERAHEEEQLIGRRYRPIGPRASRWLSAIDTLTEQQVFLSLCAAPVDFEQLSSLEHPNLIRVLDLAWTPARDSAYLVLELSQPGRELNEAARNAPLVIVLEWLSELLRALHYLHCRGFGHAPLRARDVTVVGGRLKVSILELAEFGGQASVDEDLRFVGAVLTALPGLPEPLRTLAGSLRAGGALVDARQALAAIARASERELTLETAETRESFLRTMPLLGREQVVTELRGALGVLPAGRGAAYWIDGESGVGKSRLLEELRRFALARGVLVLEGREEANAPSPYQVFRLPLFRLGLRTSSAVLEEYQLAALASLIPELRSRLGRTSSTAADDDAATDALNAVALTLVRQQREPMLLILEDMQWSGSESYRLLADLVALCDDIPLLIVASCRSEDGDRRAPMPRRMRRITLERLGPGTVSDLCAQVTSSAAMTSKELAELLVRETEGNPFFLVEALRALAEEAGSLDGVSRAALPARIFAGGIQAVVQRRLAAVPSRDRPLLQAAAVLGRGVDAAVLEQLRPDIELERWLDNCVMAAVLERVEGGRDSAIRFRHDKLRDALLAELSPAETRRLQGEVAGALERVYGEESAAHWAALARHYRAAGDDAKELTFAARAGRQALATRATDEAAEFLTRAFTLATRVPRPDLLPWLHALGAELEAQRLAWAASRAHVEAAFASAGRPLWSWRLGNAFFLFAQLVLCVIRGALPIATGRFAARDETNRALLHAAEVLINVSHITADSVLTLSASLLTFNVSEPGRCSSVPAWIVLALAAKAAGLRALPTRLMGRATALLPATNDRKELAEALSHCGLYSIGEGELEQARQQLGTALEISASIGYPLGCAWSEGQLAVCAYLEGRFDDMRASFERGARYSPPADPARVAAQAGQLIALVRLGRLAEARALYVATTDVKPEVAPLPRAVHAAASALLLLESGQLPAALDAADRTRQILPWAVQVPAVCSEVLTLPIEVYLRAWSEAQRQGADLARFRRLARQRIAALARWARLHPVAQPMAEYFAGRALQLAGRGAPAAAAFERAANGARSLGLCYYERAATEALLTLKRARDKSPM